MTTRRILLIINVLIFFITVKCVTANDQIAGILLDKITEEPISYGSVYGLNGMNGTTSNLQGEFVLNNVEGDSLVISCIGYQTQKISITDFENRERCGIVYLSPIIISIDGIDIVEKKIKRRTKMVGNVFRKQDKTNRRYWLPYKKGDETGIVIKNQKVIYLTKAYLHVHESCGDLLKHNRFVIKVRQFNGVTFTNIISDSIFIDEKLISKVNTEKPKGKDGFDMEFPWINYELNLKQWNIRLTKAMMFSIEALEDELKPSVQIMGGCINGISVQNHNGSKVFYGTEGGPGISLEVEELIMNQ